MTGATHSAIAASLGILAGCPKLGVAMLAGGALLPDIDHPQSTIGRVLFPISIPLNIRFGHRGVVHSFWVWAFLLIPGIWIPGFLYLGLGALLHIVADCSTVSGVRAMAPFTDKLFVLFKRSWRIKTGGSAEFAILAVAGTLAWSGAQIGQIGGVPAVLGLITGSPKIMIEEYRTKGLMQCSTKATIRWNSGKIEKGEWLIIGTQGAGVALLHEGKLVKIPGSGMFLKARLVKSDKHWAHMDIKGFQVAMKPCYFLDTKEWRQANQGDVVWGRLLGDEIVLKGVDINRLVR